MPRNQFQRMIFALLSVFFTVHGYIFYSLYIVNGNALMQTAGTDSVIAAINQNGGVYMLGHFLPIWAVVLVEFCLAYLLENVMGMPGSFKLACKVFNPKETHPFLFETAVICATAMFMCPAMSLIAAFLYYPYYAGFNIFTLAANWIKLICLNFPFALLSQVFFIQPLVRTLFKFLFCKDIDNLSAQSA